MPPRSPDPGPDDGRLRDALVAAGLRLGARGLIAAGEGNVSVRLAGGELLITPAGRRKDELAPDDMLVVPIVAGAGGKRADGGTVDGRRPSSDVAIHRAIYAARSDVAAVVHAHLPTSMALTLAGEIPDPAALPETTLLLPRLPLVPFGAPGSAELAARVAAAFAAPPEPRPGAVLLERHGAVAVGGDEPAGKGGGGAERAIAAIVQAVDRLELVEVLCRTWRDALLIGAASSGGTARAILRPPSPDPRTPARGRTRQP